MDVKTDREEVGIKKKTTLAEGKVSEMVGKRLRFY